MRLSIFLVFILTLISCTDREESVGGLIGDYTHGDTPKVEVSSVDVHDNSGYTIVNPIQVTINANDQAYLMRFGLDSVCGNLDFEPFQSSNTVTLQANTAQTIYIQVKDTEDERTGCLSYPIVHDNLNPQNPSFTNTGPTVFFSSSLTQSARTRWNSNDNGPAGIDHYELAISTTSDESGIIGAGFRSTGTGRNYIYTGLSLSQGVDYYSLVRAYDRAGNESSLRASPAWQVYLPSDAPDPLTLVEALPNSIEITWTAPNDNGNPITDYLIQYRETGTSTWANFTDAVSDVVGVVVTGLDPETQYDFRVRAFNGYNYSPYSSTYSFTTTRIYRAINISGASANQIVSFEDDNDLTHNGVALTTLNQGATTTVAASLFDIIEGTKPFYVAGALGAGSGAKRANGAWANEDYPGQEFHFSHYESTPFIVNIYALEDSDITITSGGVTYETQTITAGNGQSFSLNTIANYHLSSTGNILAFGYANGDGTDYISPRVLLPISSDLLGIPYDSALISPSADTSYNVTYSDGTTASGNIFFETTEVITQEGVPFYPMTEACRVLSSSAINITSFDAEGTYEGASSFMPVSMMKTKYAVNVDSDYVFFVSTSSITVTRTNPDTSTSSVNLTGSAPYKASLFNVDAGTIFESATPFAVWYLPASDTNGAQGDETLLFGWDN